MTNDKNKPARKLRDGSLTATIWRNQTDKGCFYSVNFTRSYKADSGDWKDTDSIHSGDLLKLAYLAGKAYDAVAKLRQDEDAQNGGQQ